MDKIVSQNPDRGNYFHEFQDGSIRNVAELETVYIGKGTYKPGWRWSEDAGSQTGKPSERHIGYVLSGQFSVKSADGNENKVGPGEAFEVGPNHDVWVSSNEPCIALDFEVKAPT
jgi:hypothetical protein